MSINKITAVNANQLRRAASAVGLPVLYETRVISTAYDTGSSNSIDTVTGWWYRDYFLGRTATEAWRSLPDQRGDPIPAKMMDVRR